MLSRFLITRRSCHLSILKRIKCLLSYIEDVYKRQSSIDTRTESIVQQGMDALMHGRTNFAIAHRLSTVRDADVIMVMEDGCIIERGTHEQLIEEGGQYYQLHIGAFELK